MGNPVADALAGAGSQKRAKVQVARSHPYDTHDWNALQLALNTLPTETVRQSFAAERARLLFSLLQFLGLKASEVVEGKMNYFRREGGIWVWRLPVTSSRTRPIKVAVPDEMMESLCRYRTRCGMSPLPDRTDTNPLLVSTPRMAAGNFSSEGVNSSVLIHIISTVATSAADLLPPEMSHKAEALRSITYVPMLELALRQRNIS